MCVLYYLSTRRFSRREKTSGRKPERYVHQAYEYGHFNQRSNNSGKRLTGVNSKDSDSHRNSKLEIVARCSECQRGRLSIVDPDPPADIEGEKEHDDEVHKQRCLCTSSSCSFSPSMSAGGSGSTMLRRPRWHSLQRVTISSLLLRWLSLSLELTPVKRLPLLLDR